MRMAVKEPVSLLTRRSGFISRRSNCKRMNNGQRNIDEEKRKNRRDIKKRSGGRYGKGLSGD